MRFFRDNIAFAGFSRRLALLCLGLLMAIGVSGHAEMASAKHANPPTVHGDVQASAPMLPVLATSKTHQCVIYLFYPVFLLCVIVMLTLIYLLLLNVRHRREIELNLQVQKELGLTLSTASSIVTALTEAMNAALRISDIDFGACYLRNEKTGTWELIHRRHLSAPFAEIFAQLTDTDDLAEQLLQGNPLYPDPSSIPGLTTEMCRTEGIFALAIIPVIYRGKMLASLHLGSCTRTRFAPHVRTILETVVFRIKGVFERLKSEEALRKSEAQFRTFVEHTDDLVGQIDSEFRITYVNQAAQKIYGLPMDYYLGRNVITFLHPDDCERTRLKLREWIAQKESDASIGNRLLTPSGKVVHLLWTINLNYDREDRLQSIFAIAKDISEQKRMQQQITEVSTREQHRLGQDIHDTVGQSLTGIAFLSQALARSLTERGLETDEAETAREIAHIANETTRQARSLAKNLCPVGLHVDGLVPSLREFAKNAEKLFGIECHFSSEPDIPNPEDTAATQLYHIVREAVNNAVKHGRASRVFIQFKKKATMLRLSIRDTGCGIAMEKSESCGMGLHIMRFRAESIGGVLEVYPHPRRGTLVVCDLPVPRGTKDETIVPSADRDSYAQG
jgi:two-component system CheB/CheR fusion protein